MRKTLMFVSMLTALTCSPLFSADWNDAQATLVPLAKKFLSLCASKEEVVRWDAKIKGRIQQKITDSSTDEESAIQSIALDWFSSNGDKVKKMDIPTVKIACFFLVCFFDMGFQPPSVLREKLVNDVKEISLVLSGVVKTKEVENKLTVMLEY
jgi:hypothetical protein